MKQTFRDVIEREKNNAKKKKTIKKIMTKFNIKIK